MGNECFYQTSGAHPGFGAGFDISESINDKSYLISNAKESLSEIYAPEINVYEEGSLDLENIKLNNIGILYQARILRYDGAQDVESSVRVGKRVVVISGYSGVDVTTVIKEQGFDVYEVPFSDVSQVVGTLGNFTIKNVSAGSLTELSSDHVIWAVDCAFGREIIGLYDLKSLGVQGAIERLQEHCGIYRYANGITYNAATCSQRNKKIEVCGKCVDVCPRAAITLGEGECAIGISHIQCDSCGKCISLCPTGALDYASFPRETFRSVAKLYKGNIALVIGEDTLENGVSYRLPEKVLPFVVDNLEFIDEDHLISLVQATGFPLILWRSELTEHQRNCVTLVNTIFTNIYSRQVVYICSTASQLLAAVQLSKELPINKLSPLDSSLSKRDRISQGLATMVGNEDFGVVIPESSTPYGKIRINKENCTLCLSCVTACTAGALVPHSEDNSLRFTPSSCVQCGYCETICPENNCLEVVANQLELNKDFFIPTIMAKDALFSCIECGEKFAPVKAIKKIISLMTPSFGDDSLRIKSLSCCPDCKAKVMLEAMTTDI